MTLPGHGARQHNTDEAPWANPCARGIGRNSRKGRGRRAHRPQGTTASQAWMRASPPGAEQGSGTPQQRQAEDASAAQSWYVPSQNACAYSTTVEHPHPAQI